MIPNLRTTKHATKHDFDVIIIGAGGAGLMAALSAIKNGVKNIAVISKVFPTNSHTVAAKGGINAALGNFDEDNWQWHAYDTIKSSDYLADEISVNYMCQKAPQVITDLERMGVVFSRFPNGKIYQRAYGGQSKDFGKGDLAHRACSAADSTGQTILHTLYQKCLSHNVRFFNEFFLSDLLIENNLCFGAVTIDLSEGEIVIFKAKNTIIATGGGSQIYQNTTSANSCTGDGAGAILRSGLYLQDMEFVQFHPTGLHQKNLLITEAARGEGGYLLNSNNERFMERYSPKFTDLAPRDVVARAIATEIKEGRGCGENKDHVLLKIDHLGHEVIEQKLPGLLAIVQAFAKIDPRKDSIPVTPLAHYSMGGIPVNDNCQVTYFVGENADKNEVTIPNLLAIGEAACVSVHGANRMGCNSLLDIVVFGDLAGEIVAKSDNQLDFSNFEKLAAEKIARIEAILAKKYNSELKIEQIKPELQKNMQQFAGIFRNAEMLQNGLNNIIKITQDFQKIGLKNKGLLFNEELISYLEAENLLAQSLATIYSCLQRQESRGAHWREDFPLRNDENWQFHSLVSIDLTKLDLGKLDLDKIAFDFKKKPVRKASN